jgi:hypothetical protein
VLSWGWLEIARDQAMSRLFAQRKVWGECRPIIFELSGITDPQQRRDMKQDLVTTTEAAALIRVPRNVLSYLVALDALRVADQDGRTVWFERNDVLNIKERYDQNKQTLSR